MTVKYSVECPAYTAGPFPSRSSAERNLAHIEDACREEHEVVEVRTDA